MSDRRDPAVEALADALDKGLRRAQEAIDRAAHRNAGLLEKMAKHTGEKWLSELAKNGSGSLWAAHRDHRAAHGHAPFWSRLDAKLERRRLKHELKVERLRRKEERRRNQHDSAGAGIALVTSAVAMGGMAFLHPELWWLLFPALGLGTGGASILSRKLGQKRALPAPAEAAPAQDRAAAKDPRDARVDGVCTKILEELKNAPASVKELVGKSDKTIEQLRATCRSLTQRERELRALVDPADDARLSSERDALIARIGGEGDPVVKARLQGALEALEAQRTQRRELTISAARFEAEHTRIAYTLENLFTQILRLKSADSAGHDPASAALRQSLAQLGEEIEAVADAMESVNGAELSPVAPVESDPSGRGRARERS